MIDKNISPILAASTLVMVSVYIMLALEIIHRSVLSLIGAIIIVVSAVAFGSIAAKVTMFYLLYCLTVLHFCYLHRDSELE